MSHSKLLLNALLASTLITPMMAQAMFNDPDLDGQNTKTQNTNVGSNQQQQQGEANQDQTPQNVGQGLVTGTQVQQQTSTQMQEKDSEEESQHKKRKTDSGQEQIVKKEKELADIQQQNAESQSQLNKKTYQKQQEKSEKKRKQLEKQLERDTLETNLINTNQHELQELESAYENALLSNHEPEEIRERFLKEFRALHDRHNARMLEGLTISSYYAHFEESYLRAMNMIADRNNRYATHFMTQSQIQHQQMHQELQSSAKKVQALEQHLQQSQMMPSQLFQMDEEKQRKSVTKMDKGELSNYIAKLRESKNFAEDIQNLSLDELKKLYQNKVFSSDQLRQIKNEFQRQEEKDKKQQQQGDLSLSSSQAQMQQKPQQQQGGSYFGNMGSSIWQSATGMFSSQNQQQKSQKTQSLKTAIGVTDVTETQVTFKGGTTVALNNLKAATREQIEALKSYLETTKNEALGKALDTEIARRTQDQTTKILDRFKKDGNVPGNFITGALTQTLENVQQQLSGQQTISDKEQALLDAVEQELEKRKKEKEQSQQGQPFNPINKDDKDNGGSGSGNNPPDDKGGGKFTPVIKSADTTGNQQKGSGDTTNTKQQSPTAGLQLAAPTLLMKDVNKNHHGGVFNTLKVLSGKTTEKAKPSRFESLFQVLGGSLINGK